MSSDQAPKSVAGQNDFTSVAANGGDNHLFRKPEIFVFISKKFEDDLRELGKKISQHEENIKYLNIVRGNFTHKIADMQETLAKHQSSSKELSNCKALSHKRSLDKTVAQIMQHERTAASVLCHLTHNVATISSDRNVIGVLATLGHVDNMNLSRLLSEYLGIDTMLALVCKSYTGVDFLERYDKEGSIDKTIGFHRLGASIGKSIDGRFKVFCLKNLMTYAGEFMSDDPQRRLALSEPKLPNGESPEGFLGFAVNMIYIDSENLSFVTDKGYGLRETLFYSLFERLQVYRTREDMLRALPYTSHGAISLDGGMIRRHGVFVLGTREEIDVNFGIWSGAAFLTKEYMELEKEMKELKWKIDRMMEDIEREQALLAYEKSTFDFKKKEFIKFTSQRMLNPMQHPVQPTHEGGPTPAEAE